MAHNLLQLSGAFGNDIYPAGSYDVSVAGHTGPYENLKHPICAVAYVSATVTLTNVTGENGQKIENNFVTGAGTGLLAAEGQMVFSEDVYAFTTDQPVKVWYSK